jgi:hypothetical protein
MDDIYKKQFSRFIKKGNMQSAAELLDEYDETCNSKVPRYSADRLIAKYRSHYAALLVLRKVVLTLENSHLPDAQERIQQARAIFFDIVLRSTIVSVDNERPYMVFSDLMRAAFTPGIFNWVPFEKIVDAVHKSKLESIVDDKIPEVDRKKIIDSRDDDWSKRIHSRCGDDLLEKLDGIADYFKQNPFDGKRAECVSVDIIKFFSAGYTTHSPKDKKPLIANLNDRIQNATLLSEIGSIEIQNDAQYFAFEPIINIVNALLEVIYENEVWQIFSASKTTLRTLLWRKPGYRLDNLIVNRGGGLYFGNSRRIPKPCPIIYPARLDMLGKVDSTDSEICFHVGNTPYTRNKAWNIHIPATPSSAFRVLKAITPTSLCDFDDCESSSKKKLMDEHMKFYVKLNLPVMRGHYWDALYTDKCKYGIFITIYPYRDGYDSAAFIEKLDQALKRAIDAGELSPRDFIYLPGEVQVGTSGNMFAVCEEEGKYVEALWPYPHIHATFRGKPYKSIRDEAKTTPAKASSEVLSARNEALRLDRMAESPTKRYETKEYFRKHGWIQTASAR